MNLHVHPYANVGETLVQHGWGRRTSATMDEFLKTLKPEENTYCLLAYIAKLLLDTNSYLSRIDRGQKECNKQQKKLIDALATQAIHALVDSLPPIPQKANDDTPPCRDYLPSELTIELIAQARLSTRAKKVLYRSNHRTLDDIKPEQLLEMKNCGIGTVREIMAWVDEQKSKANVPVPAEVHEDKPVGDGVDSCEVMENQS